MARSQYSSWDQMDQQGNLLQNGLGPAGGGFDLSSVMGKYGLPGLAIGSNAAGLLSSIMDRAKARKRAKQNAENQKLEIDNQASTAKTGIGLDTRDQLASAEVNQPGGGMYQSSSMDALRRAIADAGSARKSAVDQRADSAKAGIASQLTEGLRPGFTPEIASGASGLVRSLGLLLPRPTLESKPDPMENPGGDPTQTADSFKNMGDRGQTGMAAYDGVNDPERIFNARLAFLRGGQRGRTGGPMMA